MKNIRMRIFVAFLLYLFCINGIVIARNMPEGQSSSKEWLQAVNIEDMNSYLEKKDTILKSIYSEADYLLTGQNRNATDRFAYGDFYVNWWSQGQWYDLEEARAQEPVYLLAWLYTYDEKYQNNQTVLSTIISAIDRYCRWQLDGSSGEIGLTYATTAFMSSVLRAYRLIQNVELGRITEFNNTLGDPDDVNNNYELYLTPSDRWILGNGSRIATVDNDYFVLYTTAPAQNRRVFSSPAGWLDRFGNNYSDFDFYMSIQFLDDFNGNIPVKVQNESEGYWNVFPIVANLTGNASGKWEWSNFTVTSDKLYIDEYGRISFSIENRLAPIGIKQIIVQIDRRNFWTKTFENAGDYLNTYFNERALNQEAGAMYSLYVLYNVTGDARFLDYYNRKMSLFQSYQSDGVFPEINEIFSSGSRWISGYDGDYLQVSMYWLTMLYKEIPDVSILGMLNSSINFMAYLYFPEGQWEAGFSTRTSTSSPFTDEGMAPLYMIPYFAMSQKNGYAARIAEIYYEKIYFNNLSSSQDWYRLFLNPVAWVDLYDSLIPDPNPKEFRLPVESNGWYLKDFPKIKILIIKTPKYAAFLSYGNTTTTNALADFYEIETGKHLISSRGDAYSPWGFGVISLNYVYYNTYETEPTLTVLQNTSDSYVIKTVGYLKTSTFAAAPVSFEMTFEFFSESICLSTKINFEEDMYVESLTLGTTLVNPSQLNLLLVHPDLSAQNISLKNGADQRILKSSDVASVFFDDFVLRSEGPSESFTVLDMSNSTASPYGYIDYVGWNLAEKGKHFARGDSILFGNTLVFGNFSGGNETYIDIDDIANYFNSLHRLVFILVLTNIVTGALLTIFIVSKVRYILKRRHTKSKSEQSKPATRF